MNTLDRPETFLKIFFKTSKQISKNEDAMLRVIGFVTVSQIANHCQISCVSKSFVAVELTYVTSQDYVININDPRNRNDIIDHPLLKDSVSAHGPPTMPGPHAPHHLNPALQLWMSGDLQDACNFKLHLILAFCNLESPHRISSESPQIIACHQRLIYIRSS